MPRMTHSCPDPDSHQGGTHTGNIPIVQDRQTDQDNT